MIIYGNLVRRGWRGW